LRAGFGLLLRSAESGMKKRVLFVCTENANRSQMAEAFVRMHGGAAVEACSAGSAPSGRINPRAVEFMAEVGYDLSTHASKSLGEITGVFDAVITMGCGDHCPWVPARRREDWNLPDPKHLDAAGYRRVRDGIYARVRTLLAHACSTCRCCSRAHACAAAPRNGLARALAAFGLLLTIQPGGRQRPTAVAGLAGATSSPRTGSRRAPRSPTPAVTAERALTQGFAGIRPADLPGSCWHSCSAGSAQSPSRGGFRRQRSRPASRACASRVRRCPS
jgi:protein-tyrosine-phosphatase